MQILYSTGVYERDGRGEEGDIGQLISKSITKKAQMSNIQMSILS